ncbi:hypothetical protein ACIGXI_08050 [Kitasatospora aureofaciens]|uniref:hypothetical protein n=1 Tax=Kitasatospora aureofaciens TaxID=1894 RepID=UPI0037C71FCB
MKRHRGRHSDPTPAEAGALDEALPPEMRTLVERLARLQAGATEELLLFLGNGMRVISHRRVDPYWLAREFEHYERNNPGRGDVRGRHLPEVREIFERIEREVLQECRQCRRQVITPGTLGRPREFCSNKCRQAAFRAREHARISDPAIRLAETCDAILRWRHEHPESSELPGDDWMYRFMTSRCTSRRFLHSLVPNELVRAEQLLVDFGLLAVEADGSRMVTTKGGELVQFRHSVGDYLQAEHSVSDVPGSVENVSSAGAQDRDGGAA